VLHFTLPTLTGLSSITWFGVMRGRALVLAIGATKLVRRTLEMSNTAAIMRTLFAADALRVASTLVFALSADFRRCDGSVLDGRCVRSG